MIRETSLHRPPRARAVPVLFAAVCLALLGCAGPEPSSTQSELAPSPQRGGTLVIGIGADMRGLNPVLSDIDGFTWYLQRLLYLTLFEEQPDFAEHPPTFEPYLATSWSWSEDRTSLDLALRDDVFWSDGEPVTAEDVRWTWEMQTHPDIKWGRAESKENIERIVVTGPTTLRVDFKSASFSQLADLNEGPILPRHLWSDLDPSEWSENAAWFEERAAFSGPFRLESWDPQQQITLVRNDLFFDGSLPHLDRVVFRIVPDKSNQVRQLLSGDLDLIRAVAAADAGDIETSPSTRVISFWHRQYNFIAWNLCRPMFAAPEIRRALTLAIDRDSLVEAVLQGRGRVGASPIISTVWAADPDLEPLAYDPTEARRLLEGAGWSDRDHDGLLDKEGKTFSFELVTNSSSRVRVDAAVLIQEQLRRLGIDVRVRQMEFGAMVSSSLAHEFDGVLLGWGIDPTLDLTYAFHTRSIDDGYNFGCYSNPKVDHLIEQAELQTDLDRKTEILRELQGLLHDDQPYTILWEPQRLVGVTTRLQNAQPNPVSSFYQLRTWWLAPEAP